MYVIGGSLPESRLGLGVVTLKGISSNPIKKESFFMKLSFF
jgi:hypothetical protein